MTLCAADFNCKLKRYPRFNRFKNTEFHLPQHFLIIAVSCWYSGEYPQYNGSMERAQREIKKTLAQHAKVPSAFLPIQAEMDIHELNHRPMEDLNHQTPCSVFESGRTAVRLYTRRKRKEVYESIREKTLEFMSTEFRKNNLRSLERFAVEMPSVVKRETHPAVPAPLRRRGFYLIPLRRRGLPAGRGGLRQLNY